MLNSQPASVRLTRDILINGWEKPPRRLEIDTVLTVFHGEGKGNGIPGLIWVQLPDWYRTFDDRRKGTNNRGNDYLQLNPEEYEVETWIN